MRRNITEHQGNLLTERNIKHNLIKLKDDLKEAEHCLGLSESAYDNYIANNYSDKIITDSLIYIEELKRSVNCCKLEIEEFTASAAEYLI